MSMVPSFAKTGHSTTRGLLKEQRSHYERCHGSLENAKLQLVDLNRQYDELRLEFEVYQVEWN